jgi:hypothetical protein
MNLKEIWERLGVRPWRVVALLIGFAVMLGLVPFARYSGVLGSLGFTCDAQEKAALVEFPQYGGRVIGKDIEGPLGGEVLNFPPLQEPPPGCALEFTDRQASSKQVAAYYENKLTEHGWTVKRFPVDGKGNFEYPHVDGTRDGLRYEIHYWPTDLEMGSKASDFTADALGKKGTRVHVLVYR